MSINDIYSVSTKFTSLGEIGAKGFSDYTNDVGGLVNGQSYYNLDHDLYFNTSEKAVYQVTLSTTNTTFVGYVAANLTLNGNSIAGDIITRTAPTTSYNFTNNIASTEYVLDINRANPDNIDANSKTLVSYNLTIKPIDYFPDNVVTYDLKSSYSQDQSISLKQLYVHDKEGWQDVQSLTMQVINSAGNVIKETSSTSFTRWDGGTEWAQTNLNQSLKDIAPGNYTVRFKGSDKSGSSDPFDNKITITAAAPIKYRDFNGDGQTDIILQNADQSVSGIWGMNGTKPTSWTALPSTGGLKIAGIGDFNGDGKPDIILQNADKSVSGIWGMNGTTPTSWTALPSTSGLKIAGIGDFNGDGQTDILLQNADQSVSGIWGMNGTTPTSWTALPSTSGLKILGVGDFNGDGKPDILLQNADKSVGGIWGMNGTTPTSWTALPGTSGLSII